MDFSYSNGWLFRSKSRHGLAERVIAKESAGVDPKGVYTPNRVAVSPTSTRFSSVHTEIYLSLDAVSQNSRVW